MTEFDFQCYCDVKQTTSFFCTSIVTSEKCEQHWAPPRSPGVKPSNDDGYNESDFN